jgi:hypothetical protein
MESPSSIEAASPSLLNQLKTVVGPLRMIFWGGLLIVLDFRINGFDLLNDVLGMLLITWGVGKLSGFPVSARYRSLMLFVLVMALLSLVKSVIMQFDARAISQAILMLLLLISMLSLVAIVIFCGCMLEFCLKAGLGPAGNSWRTTRVLFIVIYLIPLGACYLILAASMLGGRPFDYNLGTWALLLIPIFFVPLIHLFISTSRMKRGASQASQPAPEILPPGSDGHPPSQPASPGEGRPPTA